MTKPYLIRAVPVGSTGRASLMTPPFLRTYGDDPRTAAENWLAKQVKAGRFGPSPCLFAVAIAEDSPSNLLPHGEPVKVDMFQLPRPGINN